MNIELSEQESQVLVSLLDIAVRARGIEAAQPALLFISKINIAKLAAAAPAPPVPENHENGA